ncbi:MAG: methyltransferase domain-containing protein [Sphingobacteriales bacterium]|nr:MAG: methyltransferase domain-containing protein [Sphingobacteriales bacterium]
MGHQALIVYQQSDAIISGDLEREVYSVIRRVKRPAILSFHAAVALAFMTRYLSEAIRSASATDQTCNWSSVLDVGSGTGLLMLMLAQRSDAAIHGIEIEPGCYQQLQQNIGQSPWSARMQVFNDDARTYTFPLQYDFIISNPPFYEKDLSSIVEGRQLAMHSKQLNLEELVTVIVQNLSPTGSAGIMLPWHRSAEFTSLAAAHNLHLCEELRIKQTPKHDWFRFIGTYSHQKKTTIPQTDLIIKSDQTYTPPFKTLLRDYYLHLDQPTP